MSRATKPGLPWILLRTTILTRFDAMRREQYYETRRGREELDRLLRAVAAATGRRFESCHPDGNSLIVAHLLQRRNRLYDANHALRVFLVGFGCPGLEQREIVLLIDAEGDDRQGARVALVLRREIAFEELDPILVPEIDRVARLDVGKPFINFLLRLIEGVVGVIRLNRKNTDGVCSAFRLGADDPGLRDLSLPIVRERDAEFGMLVR